MKQEQIKTLLINIATAAVVIGLIGALYFTLSGGEGSAPVVAGTPPVSISNVMETSRIGNEVNRTVQELEGLERSVASSIDIFATQEFKNLIDFSVPIPEESTRRVNPFVPTDWKVKLKAIEAATKGGGGSASLPSQTASAATAAGTAQGGAQSIHTATPGLMGDFTGGSQAF